MARVATHLSVSDLEREYRAAKDATAARHYQAIWLLAQGHGARGGGDDELWDAVAGAAAVALQRPGRDGAGRPASAPTFRVFTERSV